MGPASTKFKAVFFDRDGVLVRLPPYDERNGFLSEKRDVALLPGVVPVLRSLKERGYVLCVATNQPAVARGIMSPRDVEGLHAHLNELLSGLMDRFYFCPHHPEMHEDVPLHARKYRIACACRKPLPGMLLQAAEDFNLDLQGSWMIGDMPSDIAAGKAAGCRTIMVKSPCNDRMIISSVPCDLALQPDCFAHTLSEAAERIS